MNQKMSAMQMDALKEIANMGSGNASVVLSKATGREVKLMVSALEVISVTQIPRFFKASRGMVIAVYALISGDIEGNVMLLMSKECAFSFVDLLQGRKKGTTKRLSTEVQNTMKGVSLSLFRCYLDAISGFLNVKNHLDELRLIATFGETIVDLVLLGIGQKPNYLVLLKTDLNAGLNIRGNVTFFLPIESVKYLLKETILARATLNSKIE